MADGYLSVGGANAPPDELTFPKARDLALRLADEQIDHSVLVECRRSETAETVVFDVHLEVPSRRTHAIERHERIGATFYADPRIAPKVEALRSNFPVVPHLNLHLQEYPRSLCLYDERYDELKRAWTAPRFVGRIREVAGTQREGGASPRRPGARATVARLRRAHRPSARLGGRADTAALRYWRCFRWSTVVSQDPSRAAGWVPPDRRQRP